MSWVSLSLLLTLVFVGPGTCAMINRTIDDAGDEVTHQMPVYTPSNGWVEGASCNGCDISAAHGVDLGRPFNHTWHDTTVHPNDPAHTIALNFTGSAVYVFNMLANRLGSETTTETHITFFIDDEKVGQYDHMPDDTPEFYYQVPVYTNSSLPYGEHSLKIVADGKQLSLVLFDYVKYTTKADNSSVAPAPTSSLVSSETVHASDHTESVSSSTSPHPTTYTFTPSPPPLDRDPTISTSIPSPTPNHHAYSKHLAIVAGVTAALSFLCGIVALVVFRARKSIILCVRRVRRRGRDTQGHSRVYPGRSPSPSTHSSLDVNFSTSRSSLIELGSPTIAHLPSSLPYAVFREAPPVPIRRGGPSMGAIHPIDVAIRNSPRPSVPPRHSVDVPRSAVSSSRTGTNHSSSISELRREIGSLREKLRELQSAGKHRLRLAGGHSGAGGPAKAAASEVGVPVSLATLQEDV